MQLFGLPSHIVRKGKVVPQFAAKSSNNEVAIRRAAEGL